MFCRFCGNPVREQAYICPACGRQLKELPADVMLIGVQPSSPSRKFYLLTKIFSIVATVLSGITLLCGLYFILMLLFAVMCDGDSGIMLALFSIYGVIGMLGFSPFALTAGILAFVFRKKSLQPTGGFSIFAFVFGIVSFVIGIDTYLFLTII